MAVDQLVVHASRHVGQVEPTFLVREASMEDDLEEQVAELLFEVLERLCLSTGCATSARASSTS